MQKRSSTGSAFGFLSDSHYRYGRKSLGTPQVRGDFQEDQYPFKTNKSGRKVPLITQKKITKTRRLVSKVRRLPYRAAFVVRSISLLLIALASFSFEFSNPFPREPQLERDINFWINIYTKVDSQGGLLHDNRRLDIVYKKIRFQHGLSAQQKEEQISKDKKAYKKALLSLSKGKKVNLSSIEKNVLSTWPQGVDPSVLRNAAKRLRFQLGQSNHFRAGIIRSGAWASHIRHTFSDMSLPIALSTLPHVESSFNPAAYSHAGAAGLWQFTRSTGKAYLQINNLIDERLDPFKSTVAAARLLNDNYKTTGAWPLAITAYNHGATGMIRAVKELGTTNIAPILLRYKSDSFGFASRNFYIAFLAAMEVDLNAAKYFGPIQRNTAQNSEIVTLPDFVSVDTVKRIFNTNHETLRKYNPALKEAVWTGSKRIPKGYELRVLSQSLQTPAQLALKDIPSKERFRNQRTHRYKVRPGNTLSFIASRLNVSLKKLMKLNKLKNKNQIQVGKWLKIPDEKLDSQLLLADSSSPVKAKRFYSITRGTVNRSNKR